MSCQGLILVGMSVQQLLPGLGSPGTHVWLGLGHSQGHPWHQDQFSVMVLQARPDLKYPLMVMLPHPSLRIPELGTPSGSGGDSSGAGTQMLVLQTWFSPRDMVQPWRQG